MPCFDLQQVFGFYLVEYTDEIDVSAVLIFNFIEQVNARDVGEKSVFAVVKFQMHRSR